MPIPSANTSSRQRPTPAELHDSSYKPPMVCADCGANDCHCDSRRWPSHKKRSKTGKESNQTRVERLLRSPGNTLLNCRKEGEAWVDISNERLPNSRLGALYPGSRFTGMQRCGSASYDVSVDIQVRERDGRKEKWELIAGGASSNVARGSKGKYIERISQH